MLHVLGDCWTLGMDQLPGEGSIWPLGCLSSRKGRVGTCYPPVPMDAPDPRVGGGSRDAGLILALLETVYALHVPLCGRLSWCHLPPAQKMLCHVEVKWSAGLPHAPQSHKEGHDLVTDIVCKSLLSKPIRGVLTLTETAAKSLGGRNFSPEIILRDFFFHLIPRTQTIRGVMSTHVWQTNLNCLQQ